MDEPDKQQRGVSNNNKQTGNTNTNTSKKICSGTDASTRARSHNTETNRVHKKRPKNDTHVFVRPRTLNKITSTFQLMDKKANGKNLVFHLTNISSQAIRKDLFSRLLTLLTQYKTEVTWIQMMTEAEEPRAYTTMSTDPSFTSNIATSRTDTTHEMVTPITTTMDVPRTPSNTDNIRTSQPTIPSTTTEDPTPSTSTDNTTTDGPTHRRRRSSCSSSGSSRTTDSDNIEEEDITGKQYYTFILHKTNQNPNWQATNRGKPSPNFITFDHGTHYHVLYASDDRGGNGARQRGRIAAYLGATVAGSTEINSTHSKIQFLRRFILYCIRKGIETANRYGTRINQEMKEAYGIFQELFHNRDPNEIQKEIKECKKYIEEEETFQRLGKNKRRNMVDTITDIIRQYNIKTNADWNIQVDTETKHQLMREYGLSVDNYVQRLIRAKKNTKI